MSLSHEDLLEIKQTITDSVGPLAESIRKHEQTLYGENGENGLRGDMKSVRKTLVTYGNKFAWIWGVGAAIVVIGGAADVAWHALHGG